MNLHTLHRYHDPLVGNYVCIPVSKGHKWIKFVTLGYPIAVHKAKVTELKFFTELGYKADPIAKFLTYSAHMGITKAAKGALNNRGN
jgi:hypothetical protein